MNRRTYARIDNPQAVPITGLAGGTPIHPDHLTPARLRATFAQPTDWQPEIVDDRLDLVTDEASLTPAAVLVPLVQRDDGLSLLLTRRTAHLHDHAGQISFPGGRVEDSDKDAIDTALRETEEEIGLARHHIEPVGHLPHYLTRSGFRVMPVVSLVTPPFDLKPDDFEVAEIFEVPLGFIMDPANHQVRTVQLDTGPRTFFAMPYNDYFIWGATAGMLRTFYSFLDAHLPQR